MIRLTRKPEPFWLDVGYGVRLRVNPFQTWVYDAARFESLQLASDTARKDGYLKESGLLSDIDNTTVYNKYLGIQQQIMKQVVARHAIIEWEGVGGEDGDDLAPCTPEYIDALMVNAPLVAEAFRAQYFAPMEAMIDEGEDLGSAPKTSSTAGPIDAPIVENSGAPLESAPNG